MKKESVFIAFILKIKRFIFKKKYIFFESYIFLFLKKIKRFNFNFLLYWDVAIYILIVTASLLFITLLHSSSKGNIIEIK